MHISQSRYGKTKNTRGVGAKKKNNPEHKKILLVKTKSVLQKILKPVCTQKLGGVTRTKKTTTLGGWGFFFGVWSPTCFKKQKRKIRPPQKNPRSPPQFPSPPPRADRHDVGFLNNKQKSQTKKGVKSRKPGGGREATQKIFKQKKRGKGTIPPPPQKNGDF